MSANTNVGSPTAAIDLPAQPIGLEVVKIEIAKLECGPGDIVVIKVPKEWTMDQVAWMQRYLHAGLPNHRFLLLPDEMDLTVVAAPPEVRDPFKGPVSSSGATGLRFR